MKHEAVTGIIDRISLTHPEKVAIKTAIRCPYLFYFHPFVPNSHVCFLACRFRHMRVHNVDAKKALSDFWVWQWIGRTLRSPALAVQLLCAAASKERCGRCGTVPLEIKEALCTLTDVLGVHISPLPLVLVDGAGQGGGVLIVSPPGMNVTLPGAVPGASEPRLLPGACRPPDRAPWTRAEESIGRVARREVPLPHYPRAPGPGQPVRGAGSIVTKQRSVGRAGSSHSDRRCPPPSPKLGGVPGLEGRLFRTGRWLRAAVELTPSGLSPLGCPGGSWWDVGHRGTLVLPRDL